MANIKWPPIKKLIVNGEISYPLTCVQCSKSLYKTKEDAEKVAQVMIEKGTKGANAYKCNFKEGWHVGSGYRNH